MDILGLAIRLLIIVLMCSVIRFGLFSYHNKRYHGEFRAKENFQDTLEFFGLGTIIAGAGFVSVLLLP